MKTSPPSQKRFENRLPVRPGIETARYHRPPTPAEIKFGYGATHHRDFPIAICCHAGTRFLKTWIRATDDGLRYFR